MKTPLSCTIKAIFGKTTGNPHCTYSVSCSKGISRCKICPNYHYRAPNCEDGSTQIWFDL